MASLILLWCVSGSTSPNDKFYYLNTHTLSLSYKCVYICYIAYAFFYIQILHIHSILSLNFFYIPIGDTLPVCMTLIHNGHFQVLNLMGGCLVSLAN